MRRHNGSGRLRRFERQGKHEDINPLDGVANLADVMLVFACGLMLALITYWNVDVAGVAESLVDVEQGQEVSSEMNGLDSDSFQNSGEIGYEEYGKVYRDPASGKLYMVMDE